ncbi:hypothetical protein RhiirA4_410774, partial [Rhizophagus irregularis]
MHMVHRVFKNIMPQTNRKNVELYLPKRDTTLFAVRHLFDRDLGYYLAIFGNSYQFYEYACFLAEENDTNVLHRLHIGEVVTIVDGETLQLF